MDKARLLAAVLAAAAAVATIVGSALPLFAATMGRGPDQIELTISAWSFEITGAEAFGQVPANGFPLLFAAVLLLFAAIWCRAATRPGALPRTPRVAGVATAVGAAFLACAVWMVGVQVADWANSYSSQEVTGGYSIGGEVSYLAGLWTLVLAALLGVAAAVPALLPVAPVVVVPETVDPDAPTPPYGIVLPVPVEEVDPLTGEPIGQQRAPAPPEPPAALPEPPRPEPLSSPAIPLTDDPLAEPRSE
jgi:hypothetical protein